MTTAASGPRWRLRSSAAAINWSAIAPSALEVPALRGAPQVRGLQVRTDLGGQFAGGIVEALLDLGRGIAADIGAGGDGRDMRT